MAKYYDDKLNPEHVRRLESIPALEEQGFEGSDATLEIALFEYGMAWKDLGEETLFIYRLSDTDESRKGPRFERATFDNDLDCKREFNWIKEEDWSQIYGSCEMDEKDWQSMPLTSKIYDLNNYYGHLNVFGSSYTEGFEIAVDVESADIGPDPEV